MYMYMPIDELAHMYKR